MSRFRRLRRIANVTIVMRRTRATIPLAAKTKPERALFSKNDDDVLAGALVEEAAACSVFVTVYTCPEDVVSYTSGVVLNDEEVEVVEVEEVELGGIEEEVEEIEEVEEGNKELVDDELDVVVLVDCVVEDTLVVEERAVVELADEADDSEVTEAGRPIALVTPPMAEVTGPKIPVTPPPMTDVRPLMTLDKPRACLSAKT